MLTPMRMRRGLNPIYCALCWRECLEQERILILSPAESHGTHGPSNPTILPSSRHRSSVKSFKVHNDCLLVLKNVFLGVDAWNIAWKLCASLDPVLPPDKHKIQRIARTTLDGSLLPLHTMVERIAYKFNDPTYPNLFAHLAALPLELQQDVASYLWPNLASSLLVTLYWCGELGPQLSTPNCNLDARLEGLGWGELPHTSFIEIGGVAYVSGFFVPSEIKGNVKKVVICQGQLGVVQLQWLHGEEKAKQLSHALWYLICGDATRSFTIKLKPLLVSSVEPHPRPVSLCYWDTPTPPTLLPHRILSSSRHTAWVRCIELSEEVVGITARCCHGSAICFAGETSIVKNKASLDPSESLVEVDVFVPLDKGERVAQVWIRTTKSRSRAVPVVLTSSGNYYTLGPYVPEVCRSWYEFHALQNSRDGWVSTLCYSDLRVSQEQQGFFFAVDCSKTTLERYVPQPRWPCQLDSPQGAPGDTWFFSAAKLHGMQSFRLCVDNRTPDHPVIGMLVTYNDGAVKVLGQWRMGMASKDDVSLNGQEFLFWQKGPEENQIARIAIDDTLKGWESISLSRTLVWWFSHRGSVLEVL